MEPILPLSQKNPPEPFKFGDIVRIEKKIHVGYRYEFAGVGIGAQYKDAGVSGTIAQVELRVELRGESTVSTDVNMSSLDSKSSYSDQPPQRVNKLNKDFGGIF
eukprot:s5997_g1.t1